MSDEQMGITLSAQLASHPHCALRAKSGLLVEPLDLVAVSANSFRHGSTALGKFLSEHPLFSQKLSVLDLLPPLKDLCCNIGFATKADLFSPVSLSFGRILSSSVYFSNGSQSEGMSQFGKSRRGPARKRNLTTALLILNVLCYIAQVASDGRLLMWGAKVNSLINKGQLWRLVTSSMLHANVGHLMVNCYSLNSIGPTIENLAGPRRFLAVYFASAIASSASSYWFCKAPAIGASGAIFGLVGSTAVFMVRHRSMMRVGKEQLQHIARVILLNMAIGVMSTGIDNWGHLGGLIGGAATSWFLGPAWRIEPSSNNRTRRLVDRAPIKRLMGRFKEP